MDNQEKDRRARRSRGWRFVLSALPLVGLAASRASADAIYSVTDLGTDTVIKTPGASVTVLDTALSNLPDGLKTPRTQIYGGPSFAYVASTAGGPSEALFIPPSASGKLSTSMGTLGGPDSVPIGINTAGQVVGYSSLADGTRHAFFYDGGKILDLNALIPAGTGYIISQPVAIGDDGKISALGIRNGVQHALLLTPSASLGGAAAVPEPASWVVLVAFAGAGALALRRSRRPTSA